MTAIRTTAATACVLGAVTLVAALACARAAARYENGLQLQLAQAYQGSCGTSHAAPSLAARAGLRLRGDSIADERLELGVRLLELRATRGCRSKRMRTTESASPETSSARIPYHEVLDHARSLARRDDGGGRADTLGLLGLTLVRASEIDPVNASAFVAEAEGVSREAVRLKPRDSLLQTNLEVVLRLRRQDERAQRRAGNAQRQTQAPVKTPQRPERHTKRRPLPGPGRQGAGGY